MKRVSRGREEADAEHYRAPSSLMERPRRECHHLARAGQCGLPRRHLLQRQVRVHRFQVHRRRLSNDGLASGRHRFGRIVPQRHYHHRCQQQQQEQRYQTHKKDCSSQRIEEPGDQLTQQVSVSSIVGSRRGRSWRRRRRWSIGNSSARIIGGNVTWRRQRRIVQEQQVILN